MITPGNEQNIVTVIVNALSYIVFSMVGTVLCFSVRKLAKQANANGEEAIRLAAHLEREQMRFHIHNVTGLLTRLARVDTSTSLLPSLRQQALDEANRLRSEALTAREDSVKPPGDDKTLSEIVAASVKSFEHLPLDTRTTMARDVLLSSDEALVIQGALITLLYNVQFYAQATEVVVFACGDETGWEVSVGDNGIGFDLETTPLGFGLQNQVLDSAMNCGMEVEIRSHPNEGTCVVIRVRPH